MVRLAGFSRVGDVLDGVRPVTSQCREDTRVSSRGKSRSSIMSIPDPLDEGHVGVRICGAFSMSEGRISELCWWWSRG
jgi:hypothetical protein